MRGDIGVVIGPAEAVGATRAPRDSVITLAATVFAILVDNFYPLIDLDPAVGFRYRCPDD